MAKTAVVAYENPIALKREERYRKKVRGLLSAMQGNRPSPTADLVATDSEDYVAASFLAGIPPETVAAVIWHKHCAMPQQVTAVPCVSEEATAAASPAAECPCPESEAEASEVGATPWKEILAAAHRGEDLYYQAPLDPRPIRFRAGGGAPYTYLAGNRSIRLWPPGSTGRGQLRTSDPFTADSEHADRFSLTPGSTEARDSAGTICAPFTRLERDPKKFAACKAKGKITSDRAAYEFLRPYLERQDQEIVAVLCIGTQLDVRGYTEVARGQRDHVAVDISDVLRVAVASGCSAFILAHNHPSGQASPSDKDRELTDKVREATKVALPNVTFADHVIIGLGEWFSFNDEQQGVKKAR